jgi:hypothetical protein
MRGVRGEGDILRRRMAAQLAHDELKEQERGFGGLPILWKVALDAFLFLASERRIR